MDRMTVDLQPGELDGLRLEPMEISEVEAQFDQLRAMVNPGRPDRSVRAGMYMRLVDDRHFWMSDTPAERADHLEAVRHISDPSCRRVLVNGLGLGMVLGAALSFDHVEHVDVVEIDPRVIRLVGSQYTTRDARVNIILADARRQRDQWQAGVRWDVGWTDIWPDLDTDNLSDMAAFRASYGRRCGWHDCWGRELLASLRRQERRIS